MEVTSCRSGGTCIDREQELRLLGLVDAVSARLGVRGRLAFAPSGRTPCNAVGHIRCPAISSGASPPLRQGAAQRDPVVAPGSSQKQSTTPIQHRPVRIATHHYHSLAGWYTWTQNNRDSVSTETGRFEGQTRKAPPATGSGPNATIVNSLPSWFVTVPRRPASRVRSPLPEPNEVRRQIFGRR